MTAVTKRKTPRGGKLQPHWWLTEIKRFSSGFFDFFRDFCQTNWGGRLFLVWMRKGRKGECRRLIITWRLWRVCAPWRFVGWVWEVVLRKRKKIEMSKKKSKWDYSNLQCYVHRTWTRFHEVTCIEFETVLSTLMLVLIYFLDI